MLKFATLDVPQAHLNVRVHHPWAEKINKEANGVFRIEVFDGAALANQGNIYNQVVSNVVQIGWGLPSLAGKFPLLQVAALPYVSTTDSEVASTALWRLYKTGLLDQEFDQIVPLKLIVFPQSGLQFRKRPPSLDNFDGLKLIAGTRSRSRSWGVSAVRRCRSASTNTTRRSSAAPPTACWWGGRRSTPSSSPR